MESCLISRPLCALPDTDDGVEALTPGHFLISRPLEALPDAAIVYQPSSLLRRWQLCQMLVRQFWKRRSSDHLVSLTKCTKWNRPHRNFQVGDLVCLRNEEVYSTLAHVTAVHPGTDGQVRVITVKTAKGTYKQPVTKAVLLLPDDKHC